MEASMTASWTTWYQVFASLALLGIFGRLDLLALVVPVSAAVGFGSWMAGRPASRER
jgi:hypothetical protein